jgi:hypothetical protein
MFPEPYRLNSYLLSWNSPIYDPVRRMVVLKGDIHFIVSSNIRHSQLFSYIPRKT